MTRSSRSLAPSHVRRWGRVFASSGTLVVSLEFCEQFVVQLLEHGGALRERLRLDEFEPPEQPVTLRLTEQPVVCRPFVLHVLHPRGIHRRSGQTQ